MDNIHTKRDELLARKIDIDEKLANQRIDIDEAKATARAEGKFLPPKKMAEMQRNLAFLQRESQRLQFQLRGDRKQIHAAKDQKGALFMQEFFMVARGTLPKEQFNAIAREAENRLNSANDEAKLSTPTRNITRYGEQLHAKDGENSAVSA